MSLSPFNRVLIVGIGLIGSSLALALRKAGLARQIVALDHTPDHVAEALSLGLVDAAGDDPALADGADLVILCVPVGACGKVAAKLAPYLAPGVILTDVGSVKQAVVRDVAPVLPEGVQFIPGHPISGTEYSGPSAGFAELFEGRHCILTPTETADPAAVARLQAAWEAMGSLVTIMSAEHHDRVLAITSHLPHLIAYTIVGTATDLEEHMQQEVIKYSAGGFRDFTRIAASDPIMWRDVFLNNREAVLEMLGRLHEDLGLLARAIRIGDGATLEEKFTTTRAIRRGIIAAKQA
ncbi:cyclohexadienyl dehydrogenase [Elstera litoralis]|uniref:prephenate dehydrogenase n=1 Tax=Elstera litoralis TaxID=552518 RepID=A0A0F3IWD6_9PROT|nr:prephenate/arogenate dehydrogenase family protein [Elstera litoralis]KJV09919.1 cyclohexadienyl dehydrogenase [Elstera litoralis]